MAFREFYGEDPLYFCFADNVPELKSAARQELMVQFISTPHRPESNGVVERFNQLIVDGARCFTSSPPTKSSGFRGFDLSKLLILRVGSFHVRGIL